VCIDPFKDQQASVFEEDNHVKSKRRVVSQMGGDYESVLREVN